MREGRGETIRRQRTFAHVRVAPCFARVRRTGIDPSSEVEQARWLPFSWVGDDLVE